MKALAAALLAASLSGAAAHAANVNQPYQNVDKTNDRGNDTGDAKVDTLNGAQTDKNYAGQNSNETNKAAPVEKPAATTK